MTLSETISSLLLALVCCPGWASTEPTLVTVQGAKLSYTITVPEGWIADSTGATNGSMATYIRPAGVVQSNVQTMISVYTQPDEGKRDQKIFETDEVLTNANGKTAVIHVGRAISIPDTSRDLGMSVANAFVNECGVLVGFQVQSDDKHWKDVFGLFKQIMISTVVRCRTSHLDSTSEAAIPSPAPKPVDWQARVALVKTGMKRSEVEKILPLYMEKRGSHQLGCDVVTTGTGGSQCDTYWVDADWQVSVCYDYKGIPRDASGKALSNTSPDNRVIEKVTLQKKPCPLLGDLKIESTNNVPH